ncbi:MAG: hypothetical protein Roseis2KO_24560 [Roseivirga sp.]
MENPKEQVVQFLTIEFPRLLRQLPVDAKPAWGLMTPQHMVEHLIVTYKMSIGRIKIPVISATEDHPRLKAYLMKDSPMRRSVPSPTGNNELQPLRSASLQEAVDKAIKETGSFLKFVDEQPDFMADHPYGGPMRADEWLFFHRKHIKHHFIQFNLMADYE